jgi:hypothetical protein
MEIMFIDCIIMQSSSAAANASSCTVQSSYPSARDHQQREHTRVHKQAQFDVPTFFLPIANSAPGAFLARRVKADGFSLHAAVSSCSGNPIYLSFSELLTPCISAQRCLVLIALALLCVLAFLTQASSSLALLILARLNLLQTRTLRNPLSTMVLRKDVIAERVLLELLFVSGLTVVLLALYAYNGLKTINHNLSPQADIVVLLAKSYAIFAITRALGVAGTAVYNKAQTKSQEKRRLLNTLLGVTAVTFTAAGVQYVLNLRAVRQWPVLLWLKQTIAERAKGDAAYCLRMVALLMSLQLFVAAVLQLLRLLAQWSSGALQSSDESELDADQQPQSDDATTTSERLAVKPVELQPAAQELVQ